MTTIPIELKKNIPQVNKQNNSAKRGVSLAALKSMQLAKKEPLWMEKFRAEALDLYQNLPMPGWGKGINFKTEKLTTYIPPSFSKLEKWREIPLEIRKIYEKLGFSDQKIKEYFSGAEIQHNSEAAYGELREKLELQGVIFTDTDTALKKYSQIFKKYFSTLVPPSDNKFAALNSAFWSGGSFIYVPKGVAVELPLQAYFRINSRRMGQFERSLIIADFGSTVKYIEGCSAPVYGEASLHAAVVEIFVLENASVEYITVQNWSSDIYNLVTKRALVEKGGSMRWLDVNLGSKVTMKYPSCLLVGDGARGEMVSLSVAREGQCQDTGAKMIHLAPNTSSNILSKSVTFDGGESVFRGKITIDQKATGTRAKMRCEGMMVGERGRNESLPQIKVDNAISQVSHEATVSQVDADQLFYLQSRGLSREQAEGLLVNGFADTIMKSLPLEYTMEIKRLFELKND